MVNEAKDRSKTLIKRVMHLSDTNDSFEVITKGLETWTETSKDATHYNADVLQGLYVPRWRETKDLKHETILESVNLASLVNQVNHCLVEGQISRQRCGMDAPCQNRGKNPSCGPT